MVVKAESCRAVERHAWMPGDDARGEEAETRCDLRKLWRKVDEELQSAAVIEHRKARGFKLQLQAAALQVAHCDDF